jgi:NAD(P)-dependent dehydrogenase (short-subunit alcohol dehydrogenase family)
MAHPDLHQLRVVLTGAGGAYEGRGIGRAIAVTLGAAGARLVAADIDLDAARATAETLSAQGAECVAVQVDVSSARSVDAMVAAAVGTLGGVDVLINHAGRGNHELLADTDDALWRHLMGVNLDGPFFTTRRVLPLMLEQGGGVVVNTISICGSAGGRAGAAYTIAKHGLVGLTRNVAATYGRRGIRCNAVSPGRIRARGEDGSPVEAPLPSGEPPDGIDPMFEWTHASSPPDGAPEEVAAVVAFLASDASRYVNGAVVPVDGGWIAA